MYTSIMLIAALMLFLGVPAFSSSITEWTVVEDALPGDFSAHRGFYSSFDNKIYLIGYGTEINGLMVYDLESQTWSYDERLNDVIASDTQIYLEAQFGAVINGIYYFLVYNEYFVYKFDPITPSWDNEWAPTDPIRPKGSCLTSNGVDTLYLFDSDSFETLDINSVNPQFRSQNPEQSLPFSSQKSQCVYYNGFLYLFGGRYEDRIAKINVGVNNEYFDSAQWQLLDITMPRTDMNRGEAVLAPNNMIYIGGINENSVINEVYSFDPQNEAQGLILEANTNEARNRAAFIYSPYDNRFYVIGGFYNKRSFEFSNPLPYFCDTMDCDDGSVCTTDTCATDTGCIYTSIDCDDGNICTTDTCDSIEGCAHDAIDCDDGNPCTVDSCDVEIGCVYTAKDCGDALICDADNGECMRNCNALQIDDFLVDCSVEFKANDDAIIELENSVTAIESRLDGIDGVITNDISSINTELSSNREELDGIGDDITGINARLDTNEDSITSMSARLDTNDGDISTINSEIAANEDSITSINAQLATNDANILSINARLDTNDADTSIVNNRLDANDADITSIQDALETNVAAINVRLNENDGIVDGLDVQIQDVENGITTVNSRMDGIDIDVSSISSDITSMNTELATNGANILSNIDAISTINTDIDAINVRLDQLSFASAASIGDIVTGTDQGSLISAKNQEKLIIFLAISNMFLLIGFVIMYIMFKRSAQNRYSKYDRVNVFSSGDYEQTPLSR